MSTAIERISIDAPYGSDMVADARPAIGWVTRSEADGWRLYSEQMAETVTFVDFKSFRGLNHLLMNDLTTDEKGRPTYTAAASLDKAAGRTLAQWILSLYQTNVE